MANLRGNLPSAIAAAGGFIGTDPTEAVFEGLAPAVKTKFGDKVVAYLAVDNVATLFDWIRARDPDEYNRERPACMVQETNLNTCFEMREPS